MWHILEKLNRRVARKVTETEGKKLQDWVGGELTNRHTPKSFKSTEPLSGNIVGYVSSEKAIYERGMINILADGKFICRVTRKHDAFRIMQALKRDYKEIVCELADY